MLFPNVLSAIQERGSLFHTALWLVLLHTPSPLPCLPSISFASPCLFRFSSDAKKRHKLRQAPTAWTIRYPNVIMLVFKRKTPQNDGPKDSKYYIIRNNVNAKFKNVKKVGSLTIYLTVFYASSGFPWKAKEHTNMCVVPNIILS